MYYPLFQSQPELANYRGGTTNKHRHIWSLYFVNFNLIKAPSLHLSFLYTVAK